MKKVTFGENKVYIVENISEYMNPEIGFISSLNKALSSLKKIEPDYRYKRFGRIHIMKSIVNQLSQHCDVEGVEIRLPECIMSEIFFKDLLCMLESDFSYHKYSKMFTCNRMSVKFIDGMSNPSFNEYLELMENW